MLCTVLLAFCCLPVYPTSKPLLVARKVGCQLRGRARSCVHITTTRKLPRQARKTDGGERRDLGQGGDSSDSCGFSCQRVGRRILADLQDRKAVESVRVFLSARWRARPQIARHHWWGALGIIWRRIPVVLHCKGSRRCTCGASRAQEGNGQAYSCKLQASCGWRYTRFRRAAEKSSRAFFGATERPGVLSTASTTPQQSPVELQRKTCPGVMGRD